MVDSTNKISFQDKLISPREFYHALLEPKIFVDSPNDICVMRVKVIGKNKSKPVITTIDIQEKYDSKTGFLAMEKWTGWHASIMMIEILNLMVFINHRYHEGKGADVLECPEATVVSVHAAVATVHRHLLPGQWWRRQRWW